MGGGDRSGEVYSDLGESLELRIDHCWRREAGLGLETGLNARRFG
jgi:hypothetical protein